MYEPVGAAPPSTMRLSGSVENGKNASTVRSLSGLVKTVWRTPISTGMGYRCKHPGLMNRGTEEST